MSYDSSRIALYTHLQNNITTIPIRFDSIKEDDPITNGNELWIRCYIDPFDTNQSNLGTNNPLYETLGYLNIEIYDLEENGYADILRTADIIKSLYMRKSFNNGSLVIQKIKIIKRDVFAGWNNHVVSCFYIEKETI